MRLSPLFGTALVAAVLGLLAIPLHRLTGSPPAALPVASDSISSVGTAKAATPAVARVRLLREAVSVALFSDDDHLLWKAENVPAGETEAEIPLEILRHEAVLHVRAEFADDCAETAIFVTVLPDGLEERNAHAIGAATIEERLVFNWPNAAHHP